MTIGSTNNNRGIDALSPAEIVEKAEAIGIQKTRLDVLSLLALAILAGAFIALGAMFATTVLAGTDGVPFGLSRLLSGIAFCLGLILVILGGAELFTGNTLMVMAWAAGKIRLHEMVEGLAHRLHRQLHWCDRNCDARIPFGTVPIRTRCRRKCCSQARARQGDVAFRSHSLPWDSM